MSSLPAINPCIPLSSYIPGGIHVGSRLVIRGLMPYNGERFTIDLQCGGQPMQDDIAFHLSIRPSEFAIVRNSFQYYNWGAEERFGSCPVHRGQPYEIEILAEHNRFNVRVNGSHVCEFHHRIPIQRISHIRIAGDTAVYYVGNEGQHAQGVYQPAPPSYPAVVVSSSTYSSPTYSPVVIAPPQTIIVNEQPRRPFIGAAVVGGIIGAAAATIARPDHHHHHHHGWGHRDRRW